ncbi:unnamed protein product [Amoebophrya sp. A120]|nr:unnamed protein product [Amoebophrya sp. A120]|eukprot:GSA120T00010650001.1
MAGNRKGLVHRDEQDERRTENYAPAVPTCVRPAGASSAKTTGSANFEKSSRGESRGHHRGSGREDFYLKRSPQQHKVLGRDRDCFDVHHSGHDREPTEDECDEEDGRRTAEDFSSAGSTTSTNWAGVADVLQNLLAKAVSATSCRKRLKNSKPGRSRGPETRVVDRESSRSGFIFNAMNYDDEDDPESFSPTEHQSVPRNVVGTFPRAVPRRKFVSALQGDHLQDQEEEAEGNGDDRGAFSSTRHDVAQNNINDDRHRHHVEHSQRASPHDLSILSSQYEESDVLFRSATQHEPQMTQHRKNALSLNGYSSSSPCQSITSTPRSCVDKQGAPGGKSGCRTSSSRVSNEQPPRHHAPYEDHFQQQPRSGSSSKHRSGNYRAIVGTPHSEVISTFSEFRAKNAARNSGSCVNNYMLEQGDISSPRSTTRSAAREEFDTDVNIRQRLSFDEHDVVVSPGQQAPAASGSTSRGYAQQQQSQGVEMQEFLQTAGSSRQGHDQEEQRGEQYERMMLNRPQAPTTTSQHHNSFMQHPAQQPHNPHQQSQQPVAARQHQVTFVEVVEDNPSPTLGIVRIDHDYDPVPGNIAHPSSYSYRSVSLMVPGLTFEMCRRGVMSREVERSFYRVLDQLVFQFRVSGITSDCGFMVFFQQKAQQHVRSRSLFHIPVFMSVFAHLPAVACSTPVEAEIAIFTASGRDLLPKLPEIQKVSGLSHVNLNRLVVVSCSRIPGLHEALQYGKPLNPGEVKRGLEQLTEKVLTQHPNVAVFLIECTELPPYSEVIRQATRRNLPVYDAITNADFFMSGALCNSRFGIGTSIGSAAGVDHHGMSSSMIVPTGPPIVRESSYVSSNSNGQQGAGGPPGLTYHHPNARRKYNPASSSEQMYGNTMSNSSAAPAGPSYNPSYGMSSTLNNQQHGTTTGSFPNPHQRTVHSHAVTSFSGNNTSSASIGVDHHHGHGTTFYNNTQESLFNPHQHQQIAHPDRRAVNDCSTPDMVIPEQHLQRAPAHNRPIALTPEIMQNSTTSTCSSRYNNTSNLQSAQGQYHDHVLAPHQTPPANTKSAAVLYSPPTDEFLRRISGSTTNGTLIGQTDMTSAGGYHGKDVDSLATMSTITGGSEDAVSYPSSRGTFDPSVFYGNQQVLAAGANSSTTGGAAGGPPVPTGSCATTSTTAHAAISG